MPKKEQEASQANNFTELQVQSYNRFEVLMKNSSDSVIVQKLDGKILEWNKGAERMYGYTREEALGMNINDLTHPDNLAEQQNYYESLAADSEDTIDFETQRKTKDGSIKNIWLTATRLREKPSDIILTTGQESNKPDYITLVERDITDRNRIVNELAQEKRILRASLESSQDGILVVNEEGIILSHNQRFAEMWGIAPDEILSSSGNVLINNLQEKFANPEEYKIRLQYFFNNPKEKSREDVVLKDGRIFDRYSSPVIDSDGTHHGRIWFFHDVTNRRETENKLKQSLTGTIEVISQIVELKDPYTSGHQKNVSKLSIEIGKILGFSNEQIENIERSALIHDIGKIGIPSDILSKPTRLSLNEYALIKEHPQSGFNTLVNSGLSETICLGVLQHHERLDGSGYPKGLKDNEIVIEAKIIGVADVVDAMSSHRPYRPALGIDAALAELTKYRGILYDSVVVDACLGVFKQGFSFDFDKENL